MPAAVAAAAAAHRGHSSSLHTKQHAASGAGQEQGFADLRSDQATHTIAAGKEGQQQQQEHAEARQGAQAAKGRAAAAGAGGGARAATEGAAVQRQKGLRMDQRQQAQQQQSHHPLDSHEPHARRVLRQRQAGR
jgi:hypothetical protein